MRKTIAGKDKQTQMVAHKANNLIGKVREMSKKKGKPYVYCDVCGKAKCPIGRSAPMAIAADMCDFECDGYLQEPKADHLWPNEEDYPPPSGNTG